MGFFYLVHEIDDAANGRRDQMAQRVMTLLLVMVVMMKMMMMKKGSRRSTRMEEKEKSRTLTHSLFGPIHSAGSKTVLPDDIDRNSKKVPKSMCSSISFFLHLNEEYFFRYKEKWTELLKQD